MWRDIIRHASIVLFLSGICLLFFRGKLETSDEVIMAATAMTIVENQSLEFSQPIYGKTHSEYGLMTSLAAIPFYLLQRTLPAQPGEFTFFPLVNALAIGFVGLLVALVAGGDTRKRNFLACIAVLCSPLFPVSLTMYSELLTSIGFLLLVFGLKRESQAKDTEKAIDWIAVLSIAGGLLVAMLARVASIPFLAIILFWGWRTGISRKGWISAAVAVVAGFLIIGFQNYLTRGGFFATGYSRQDFTTPLLTGLYGLLFSPERGVLIFFPLVILILQALAVLKSEDKSLLWLATTILIVSLVFHGRFWTWHGGWTNGPRFLIPSIALFLPVLTQLMLRFSELSKGKRVFLFVGLFWGGVMSWIYTTSSGFLWWNQLWGFHQLENQWLFMPQLSLWQGWFLGYPLPDSRAIPERQVQVVLTSLGIIGVSLSLFPLLSPFRKTHEEEKTLIPAKYRRITDRFFIGAIVYVFILLLVHLLAGPRGWEKIDSADTNRRSHLIINNESGTWEGWIDNPLKSEIKFNIKANANYRIFVNEQLVLSSDPELRRQHLNGFKLPVDPGLIQLKVEVFPVETSVPPLFHLYWSWGGEGLYLSPAGGEYLMPRPPTRPESFFSWIWRRKFIISAGLLALLLLFTYVTSAKRED